MNKKELLRRKSSFKAMTNYLVKLISPCFTVIEIKYQLPLSN